MKCIGCNTVTFFNQTDNLLVCENCGREYKLIFTGIIYDENNNFIDTNKR